MLKNQKRMIGDELLLKCVCRQFVLVYDFVFLFFVGIDKLVKRCLLGLNRPFNKGCDFVYMHETTKCPYK